MTFRGWPAEAIEFFEGLSADNSKSFWQANSALYEQSVKRPMEELLAEIEPEFGREDFPPVPRRALQQRQVAL